MTATLLSVVTLTSPFAVLAAQEGQPIQPSLPVTGATAPASPVAPVTPSAAVPVVLTDGANPGQNIITHGATVADALLEAGITLSHTDRVRPAPSTPITPNLSIIVTRVRMALENRNLPLPCGTVFKMSPSVAPGRVRRGPSGVPGVLTKTFLVGYVNGLSTSRKLVKRTVTRRPVPTETLAGIRVREARALPSRAGTYNRMRSLSMTATGYSPTRAARPGAARRGCAPDTGWWPWTRV